MPRIAGLMLGVLVVLLVASQLALPPLAERRVADRLERDGGAAEVSLDAFPALRLLFDDGDSFEVEGQGLRLDVTRERDVLGRLDGFDEVQVRLDDLEAGPFDVESFELLREEGDQDYETRIQATTSPREVARFLGSRVGGAFGGLLGDLTAGSLPGGGDTAVPIDLDATVTSRNGQADVSDVSGSVAGVPAGPLAELVVGAVVDQL
jgi:hypothetical protein